MGERRVKAHFEMMASYGKWANLRLYAAAAELPDETRRAEAGVFFGSLHRTLNHMIVGDVIWLARFRGQPNPPWALDHVPHDDFGDLRAAREALDDDVIRFAEETSEDDYARSFSYRAIVSPADVTQPLAPAVAHFFNHQTHHRGQCHALLTRFAGDAPSFDLIQYQRETA